MLSVTCLINTGIALRQDELRQRKTALLSQTHVMYAGVTYAALDSLSMGPQEEGLLSSSVRTTLSKQKRSASQELQ